MICRISSSRPLTGSICPLRARSVKSVANRLSASCLPICAGAIASLASPGAASDDPSLAVERLLRRSVDDAREIFGQRVELDRLELAGDGDQRVPQRRGLQHADDQVTGAHLRLAEHQRRVHPPALDRVLDVRREIRDRCRAARQTIERLGDVLGQPRRIELEVPDDAVQIGIGGLQDLLNPVHQLDVRVPAQLAEDGRALDRLVGQAIEFAEQRRTADLAHAARTPSRSTNASASRHKSSASVSVRRRPTQVVHPSR